MSPTRQRSTRDRPAKEPLSEAAVLDTALAILTAEGLDAVTMRRVAAALDTGPASLYVYVAGRDGLLRAMQDRVIGAVELEPADAGRWRDQLQSLLARVRQALVAHPGIAATLLIDPLTTDSTLRYLENLLAILQAGGFEPQDAAWAADIFSMLVTSAAIEDDVRRADRRDVAGGLRELFAGLPSDRFPRIAAHASQLVAGDGEARFRYAVDVVVDGVLARAGRP